MSDSTERLNHLSYILANEQEDTVQDAITEVSALRAERKDIITALGVYIVLTAEANAKGLAPTIPDDVRAWAESIVASHDGGPREVFAMIRAISEEKP